MSSKKFTRALFAWRDQVLPDSALPPAAFKVAYFLSQKFNEDEGGAAWPSCATIGKSVAMSEQSVLRIVRQLEARGHLAIEPGQQGRGHSNRYHMILKPPRMEVCGNEKPPTVEVKQADKTSIGDEQKPPSVKLKPPPVKIKPPLAEVISSTNLSTNSPGRETPPERDLFKHEATVESSAASKQKQVPPAFAIADRFVEFWSAYPRHVAKGAARRAFAKAIKAGVDPEAMIEGARRYAAERVGAEPRFTAHAMTWINGERWLDESAPTSGPVIDQNGNPIAERPRDQGGGTYGAVAKELAEERRRGAT